MYMHRRTGKWTNEWNSEWFNDGTNGWINQWINQTITWWRHQMETFSVLLAICGGNSPVTGEFPSQRPVTRSFDVFFDLHLNKRLSKQSWGWWLETPSRPLRRHRNDALRSVFQIIMGQIGPEIYLIFIRAPFTCKTTCLYRDGPRIPVNPCAFDGPKLPRRARDRSYIKQVSYY